MRNDGKNHTAGASTGATRARAASYKPLTLEDHIHLAPVLYAARQAVSAAFPSFPKTGSPTKQILGFQRAIDDLRCELDRQLCALVPANRDPRRLAIRVYYGGARLIPRSEEAHSEADAFGSWEVEEAHRG